jgi:hypothetical protein
MVVIVASALAGCSDWAPVHTARDIEGQRVKVQAAGKDSVIEEVVVCDEDGFIIANEVADCHGTPERTFDTRRDKVLVHQKDTKASVGLVVVGILAAIFVPAGIVGGAILSAR